jgi:hypothetical protein
MSLFAATLEDMCFYVDRFLSRSAAEGNRFVMTMMTANDKNGQFVGIAKMCILYMYRQIMF